MSHRPNITKHSTRKQRALPLDVMRVMACFFVIVVHAASGDIAGDAFQRLEVFDWLSMVMLGTMARPAMPIFLMLSGALMLSKAQSGGAILLSH